MTKSQRTEAEIQTAVIRAMKQTGWKIYRITQFPAGGRANVVTKGLPDYLVIKDTRMLFTEFKGPEGKLSPEQEEFFELVKRVKTVQCLKVSDMGDVVKQLEQPYDELVRQTKEATDGEGD